VRLFANPGERAWLEDPGYGGVRAAFHAGDMKIRSMPVDHEGVVIDPRAWRWPPRLIHVTPSHQYPTGAVLSLARRLALIARAREHGCWIIEDDYDSEFRHHGHPIPAMQGLVPDAPVLYVGTFSKTLFPGLRIGFLVLPASAGEGAGPALAELLRGTAWSNWRWPSSWPGTVRAPPWPHAAALSRAPAGLARPCRPICRSWQCKAATAACT
jgi:GntR family transcriptional regulator/MocR family aminotransferase